MRSLPIVSLAAVLLGGCAAREPAVSRSTERRAGRVGLINPLLDVEPSDDYKELRPFVRKIEKAIDDRVGAGKAETVAVYFRDLNNGPVFGVHDDRKYAPASLLKVPLMFAVFKLAQEDPSVLQRRLPYPNVGGASRPAIVASTTFKVGETYPVDELVKAMIAQSDNGSAYAIAQMLDPKAIERVYVDLGLPAPDVSDTGDTIRVREFAAFFRILYNASYLDRKMSEKALELLAASEFKDGLVAGVRPGLVVAHKFGERTLEHGIRELNDCGIVYAPETPYILCVMTRGSDFLDLAGVIRDLSALVDHEIDVQLPHRPRSPR